MPSVKNPNTVGRNRSIAQRAKARKSTRKTLKLAKLATRVAQADTRRGARTGLLPTSGPNAALSKKKQHKVEKQLAHALRRKAEMEAALEQELDMKGMFSWIERERERVREREKKEAEAERTGRCADDDDVWIQMRAIA